MSAHRKGVAALGLIGLMAVTAGCDAAPAEGPAPRNTSVRAAPAASAEARELLLPFDTYKISKADDYLIAAAEDVLMKGCLEARGVRWSPRAPVGAAEMDPPNRRRYGVIEEAVAREFGFHAPPEAEAEVRFTTARQRRSASLSDSEVRAAYGSTGTGGCWGKAHEELRDGVAESDYDVLNKYSRKSFEDSQRDGEVRAVFRSWSACMAKSGFRYRDPVAVVNDPRWSASPSPSDHEIKVALADVRCKEETGVVAVWSAVETRIQRDIVTADAASFRALKATKKAWLASARRALESTP
ncbi:hypothetical protein GCM10019016_069720 [Streptomyces prasinosporus]|uniref:Lipoprotein n=1 Tax=Streptomyces prasinosporus TaxID=68256 RepID=A0ABP6TWZ6_9ACTN